MSGFNETVNTVTNLVKTMLTTAVLGGLAVASYFGYTTFYEGKIAREHLKKIRDELNQANADLEQAHLVIVEKDKEIEQLATAMKLLKVDHRVAKLNVLDQQVSPNGDIVTTLQFIELDEQGHAVEQRPPFNIQGDVVYIDSWVVKFEDKYVERAELHRATSLVLFRRVYGDKQQPVAGHAIDAAGTAPRVYASGDGLNEYEQRIWGDFWAVANDEGRQRELGIRAAHGDAPNIKVRKGMSYRIDLRASDGLSITPDGMVPVRVGGVPQRS